MAGRISWPPGHAQESLYLGIMKTRVGSLLSMRSSGLAVLLGLAGSHLASACSDRAEREACYPEDREWGTDGPPLHTPLGFCQWSNEEMRPGRDGSPPPAFPDLPARLQLAPIGYCFELAEGEACDACPAEETDALLKEAFAEKCGYESTYFARGCHDITEDEEGRSLCCYQALAGPACPGA